MTTREMRDASIGVPEPDAFPPGVFCGGMFHASQRAVDAANQFLKDVMLSDGSEVFSRICSSIEQSSEVTPFDVVKRLPVMFESAIADFAAAHDGASPTDSSEDFQELCGYLLRRIEQWVYSVEKDAVFFL